MKKLLVTGGSGFIGTNFIQYYRNYYEIINVDIAAPKLSSQQVYWKKCDILDKNRLDSIIHRFKPNVVLHLAAKADLGGKSLEYYSVNFTGTEILLDSLRSCGALEHVLIASTMLAPVERNIESTNNNSSIASLYATSKWMTETVVMEHDSEYKKTIFRPTSIWGPYMENSSYYSFIKLIARKIYVTPPESSSSRKSMAFVQLACEQIEYLINRSDGEKIYYLSDVEPTNICVWANELAKNLGVRKPLSINLNILFVAAKFCDVLRWLGLTIPFGTYRFMNMTKDRIIPSRDIVPLQSRITLSEACSITIQWFRRF
jgi:nucleoside-diphosphate-sugar epimerase